MQSKRCAHFSTDVEVLQITGTTVNLRIPIRRCALADQMLALLARTEEGQNIVGRLTVADSEEIVDHSAANAAGIHTERHPSPSLRAAFGPDLEPIHPHDCTVGRCQESCSLSYRAMLIQFGLREEADKETGDGCLEVRERSSNPIRSATGD